ncbi:MAG: Rnase Y domain-containing protein, partial [Dehalococcoidia bacterium]
MDALILVVGGAIAFSLGAAIMFVLARAGASSVTRQAREDARLLVEEAENRARKVELDADQRLLGRREELENEIKERRSELSRGERRLEQREEAVERRAENLEKAEQALRDRVTQVERTEVEVTELRDSARAELERVAGLTAEEARQQLMDRLDNELQDEGARRVRAMEASVRAEADVRSRKILATVMQRMTSEVTAETTVSVVPIPSDEIKGRIIGREGRNIRAFEAATGCDLIIDDTPEVVTVSGFDPVRREIARNALARLIQDGRIQPTRIEEAVDRARGEIEKFIEEAGKQALIDAEVTSVHPEITRTLGKLRYRYSYGQNQLRHCIET